MAEMTNYVLLNRVCETNSGYLALGNDSWRSHDAMFIRNRKTPRRNDANCITMVRAESGEAYEELLKSFYSEYEGCHRFYVLVDGMTPPAFAARMTLEEGFTTDEGLVQVLEGDLRIQPRLEASSRSVEVREVLSEDDWLTYRELDKLWWRESGESFFGAYDSDLHDELMLHVRLKSPEVRRWFACVEGVPRAFFASWPGENGVGMVEDLFCHPDYRRRGLATALIQHCVADSRERGAGPVIINSDPKDTPKYMYAAMGFRPFYLNRAYIKRQSP